MKNAIIQNEAKCLKCGDIIWSAHRQDFKQCSCGAIAIDGGMDYIRRVGNAEDIEERSLTTDKKSLVDCIEEVEFIMNKDLHDSLINYEIAIAVATKYKIESYPFWDDEEEKAFLGAVKWGKDAGRNSLGIVLAVIRALRDNNCLNMEKFNNE